MNRELVKPHTVISREVTEDDVEFVIEEYYAMKQIIDESKYCVALAHPQIEDKDPLRFYVLRNGEIIINPVIEVHSNYEVDSVEGCMTFKGREDTTKKRWRKTLISYVTIGDDNKLTERRKENLTGLSAYIAQHEIDHLNGKYCYDE